MQGSVLERKKYTFLTSSIEKANQKYRHRQSMDPLGSLSNNDGDGNENVT